MNSNKNLNKTIKEMPKLNQRQMKELYDKTIYGGLYFNTYKEENEELTYEQWNKKIELDMSKAFEDLTVFDVLNSHNNARKLIFKNDKLSRKELRKVWKECLRLREDFEMAQNFLHGLNPFIVTIIEWYDLIKITHSFDDCTEKQIMNIYDNAKFLVELEEVVDVYYCISCGKHCYSLNRFATHREKDIRNIMADFDEGFLVKDSKEVEICDECIVEYQIDSRNF